MARVKKSMGRARSYNLQFFVIKGKTLAVKRVQNNDKAIVVN